MRISKKSLDGVVCDERPRRINLFVVPTRPLFNYFSITNPLRISVLIIVAGIITLPLFTPHNERDVLAQTTSSTQPIQLAQTTTDTPQEQRRELEGQLADLERQIEEHQKTIEQYQKQGKNLKNEIGGLTTKIDKLNLQIKSVTLNLKKVNETINETQRQINHTENKIDIRKEALAEALKVLYENDRANLLAVLMANSRLSDFFGNMNNITLVQENVRGALIEISKLRQDLLEQKDQLSLQKEDAENLKAIQEAQKRTVQSTQAEKQKVLQITKGKESEYKKLLVQTQATAAQIRSRIFELFGGGELTFERAYDYAHIAENATGVRAAMILAILHRESLLGKNTGRCSYKTAMHPTRDIPIFLDILQKLGIDPESTVAKVSCPNKDGRYGGAMGPAQFIPSTWKMFSASIAAVTGSNPPNPWASKDAFAATGLYLKKFGADTKNKSDEKRAAASYYCGTSWQRSSCLYYANAVLETANQFENDIKTITTTASS